MVAKARRKHLVWLIVAGFVVLLMWSTMASQQVECDVCVEFNGRPNCATASAANEAQAAQSAQTTACGTVSSGMAEAVLCGDAAPVSRRCRTL
jgi:hypothetical protein